MRFDLSDEEWTLLEPLMPKSRKSARSDDRKIMNAIFYVLRTGCQWRALPHDLPPWKTVYTYFRVWRLDGTWRRIHDTLRRQVRRSIGKQSEPSAAILDSQTVKTTEKGGRTATMLSRRERVVSPISSATIAAT